MNDWNAVDQAGAMIEEEMTDAGKANGPKQAKGGVFAPADIELIKRALNVYLVDVLRAEESDREPSPELSKISSLLHRLGRIA